MRLRSYQRKVYDWLVEHWFVSSLISSAPAFVFTFVQTFGVNYGLVDEHGAITSKALNILVGVFIFSVVYNFLLAWLNSYDTQSKKDGQFVLNRIRESLDAIKDTKLRRFSNYISTHHGKRSLSPFKAITQPRDQIECILENLQDTLADILGLERHEISLSVMYKIADEPAKQWRWLYTFNMANDWKLEDLVNDPRSTMRQIIDGKTNSAFFPSKKKAIEKNQYLPGPKDSSNNNIGSIICRDVSVDHRKSVQAILSISTFGHQICEENDDETQRKVLNLILPSFEKRIKLELALIYIKEVMSA